jgi:hypothetical protein
VKRIVIILIIILFSLFLIACSADAPARPEHQAQFTASTAPLPYLLPDRTLLAVEIHDLAGRWPEIRAVRPLARFQDRLLEGTAIRPDQLPLLAGNRMVVALVTGSDGRALLPLALRLPPSDEPAAATIRSLGPDWSVIHARGAMWIAPSHAAAELEDIAVGDGTSLGLVIPLEEADGRLSPGGLARGWLNPAALRRLLQTQMGRQLSDLIDVVGGFITAELEAVRWIGFRRDFDAGRIVTDAVTVYDTRVLPREVARLLDPAAAAAYLPAPLPQNVVMAAAFRPEAQATIPWLQFLAERDPDGPLRNIEFWADEFEERTGRSLANDLSDAIGERAWLLVLQAGGASHYPWLIAFQSPHPERAETMLLDLLDWSVEQAWARTLGLAVPRVRDYQLDGMTIHEVAIRTPLGELAGPVFAAVDGHIVAATGEETVLAGAALLESGAFSNEVGNLNEPAAHASLWLRGPALAAWVNSILALCDADDQHANLSRAVTELLLSVSSASAQAWYEVDAVRMHGEISLDGWE